VVVKKQGGLLKPPEVDLLQEIVFVTATSGSAERWSPGRGWEWVG
jgi:hypothetical protein